MYGRGVQCRGLSCPRCTRGLGSNRGPVNTTRRRIVPWVRSSHDTNPRSRATHNASHVVDRARPIRAAISGTPAPSGGIAATAATADERTGTAAAGSSPTLDRFDGDPDIDVDQMPRGRGLDSIPDQVRPRTVHTLDAVDRRDVVAVA